MEYWKYIIIVIIILFLIDIGHSFYSLKIGKELSLKTHKENIVIENDKPLKKILFVGDSIAAGVGATSQNTSISGRFAKYLSENYSISLENQAVSGNKIEDLVDVNFSKKSDITVMIISSNDLFRFTSKKEFEKNTKKVISEFSQETNKLIIVGPGRIYETNALPFFTWPFYRLAGQWYGDILENVSKEYSNVSYVNPYDTLDLPEYEGTLAEDNFHPNDEGHKYWFDMVKLGLEK